MDSDFEYSGDPGVGWPTYVDFLSSFIFILLLLIGALLYLASGDIEEEESQVQLAAYSAWATGLGVPNYVDGKTIVISLKDKVVFPPGIDKIGSIDRTYLNAVGAIIAQGKGCSGIVIQGFADKQPVRGDPEFGNWSLSARRAMQVLRYLYLCAECSYTEETQRQVQAKLRLAGQGDVTADARTLDSPGDRRVDVILDCEKPNAK